MSIYVVSNTERIDRYRENDSMRKQKMCVRSMEDNEDDRVVNVIINYFATRVNKEERDSEGLVHYRRCFSSLIF